MLYITVYFKVLQKTIFFILVLRTCILGLLLVIKLDTMGLYSARNRSFFTACLNYFIIKNLILKYFNKE